MDPTKVQSFTIAVGGTETLVSYLDGKKETVKVGLLVVDAYGKFFAVLNNEYALADLVCDKDAGWSRGLHPDSVMTIAEIGTELNFTLARRWAERRVKLDENALSLANGMERVQKKLASENSAPTLA